MAVGIVEKGSAGLFDNEIELNGKYATMIRFLKEDVGLFTTFREAYINSAIIGFVNNSTGTEDNKEKVQPASIFPSDLSRRKPDLRFIYRLIMLLKEEPEFTLDDYKNRTFCDDPEENSETLRKNMAIFNAYACGGLEFLYDKFQNCNRTEDMVDVLYDFLHSFSIEVGLQSGDEELPDFDPDYN